MIPEELHRKKIKETKPGLPLIVNIYATPPESWNLPVCSGYNYTNPPDLISFANQYRPGRDDF